MSGAQRTRRSSTRSARIQLSAKQANIYTWQKGARFRYAVCGRRFGKTYFGAEEMRQAYRLAVGFAAGGYLPSLACQFFRPQLVRLRA